MVLISHRALIDKTALMRLSRLYLVGAVAIVLVGAWFVTGALAEPRPPVLTGPIVADPSAESTTTGVATTTPPGPMQPQPSTPRTSLPPQDAPSVGAVPVVPRVLGPDDDDDDDIHDEPDEHDTDTTPDDHSMDDTTDAAPDN